MKDHPYLVCRHTDAGHPHVHIVSMLIDADDNRINTNNIGRNQSTLTRLSIGKEFWFDPCEPETTSRNLPDKTRRRRKNKVRQRARNQKSHAERPAHDAPKLQVLHPPRVQCSGN
jgi:hypothetical protein